MQIKRPSISKKVLVEEIQKIFRKERNKEIFAKDIDLVLSILTNRIKHHVDDGRDVKIKYFGSFSSRKIKARKSRNPGTGELFIVDPYTKPIFRPSKNFKEFLR